MSSFIDALGFRGLCEDRLGQFVPAGARYRPGGMVGSVAVMLAGGGEHVSDLYMLRSSAGVFGKVASNATMSRFFQQAAAAPEVFEYGFATMARELRSRVWEAAGDRNPGSCSDSLEPADH